jgi:hypothetical protein
MKIERFEDIEAWQIARQLTLRVYEITNKGTFARDFGLRYQIGAFIKYFTNNKKPPTTN